MLGIIVQLALSWLIIWLFEKGNLSVLGFYPTKRRLLDFFFFFLIAAVCCASGFLMKMYFIGRQWELNPLFTAKLVLTGIWWNIKSVLFEELIFRGVLFYILIKKLGHLKAIIISAVAFGIYHWFSFGVFGNALQMVIVFFITGIMGLVYAYGYSKTFSLYIPCAIHLGWNLTQGFVFSGGPTGNQLLVPVKPEPVVTISHFTFYCIQFVPLICVIVVNFLLLKKRKQVAVLHQ